MSSVDTLLAAARYLDMQEMHQKRQVVCTPPDSPVTAGGHYLLSSGVYINSTIIGIDGNMEEPVLYDRANATPVLLIPNSNNHQHYYHPTHSLSPHSYDSSRSRSSSLSSNPISANGVHHMLTAGEDSSQSSLNLSNASSGYLSGSSANSSVGNSSLNLSGSATAGSLVAQSNCVGGGLSSSSPTSSTSSLSSTGAGAITNHLNGISSDHHNLISSNHQITNRRRTISSNSNGGTQRSPCILRAGTREVHNKMEKNRRAQLKECFEQLKKQLPQTENEKKTSNLSILGNACRTVQSMKRKERELEHEMERLAKEKVAQQKKILLLKRELSAHLDQDPSFLITDNDITIGNVVRERFSSESLSESPLPTTGRPRYSSTSSLSSAATASSPCAAGIPTQAALTISSVIPNSPNSPQRPHSSSPTTMISPVSQIATASPKDFTTTIAAAVAESNQSLSSLKITPVVSNGFNSVQQQQQQKHHNRQQKNQQPLLNTNQIAINFTTSDGILTSTTNGPMPVSLSNVNVSQSGIGKGIQIISAISNNNNSSMSTTNVLNGRNGIRSIDQHQHHTQHQHQQQQLITVTGDGQKKFEIFTPSNNKMDAEPPKKVLKLINGSIALTSLVDKDNKVIPPGSLTLSQVVVSPLPIHVIGQTSNGLATIELSNPNGQRNSCQQMTNGAQLHKLLVNGTTATSNILTTTPTTNVSSELARLPGGAELNILSTGTNSTGLYRNNGKLAMVNNGGFTFKSASNDTNNTSGRAVHMVTSMQNSSLSGLTPIVVSQSQNATNLATHILASSQQLAGKVMATPISVNSQGLPIIGTQYLSTTVVKPMVVTVAGNGTTVHNGSITIPITSSTSNKSTAINGNSV